jgi:hypothetical protein
MSIKSPATQAEARRDPAHRTTADLSRHTFRATADLSAMALAEADGATVAIGAASRRRLSFCLQATFAR